MHSQSNYLWFSKVKKCLSEKEGEGGEEGEGGKTASFSDTTKFLTILIWMKTILNFTIFDTTVYVGL